MSRRVRFMAPFAVPFETAFGILRDTAKVCATIYVVTYKFGKSAAKRKQMLIFFIIKPPLFFLEN